MNVESITNIDPKSIVLILSSVDKITDNNVKILKILTNKSNGLYITLSKPYASIKSLLEKKGVNVNRLFFIDAITKEVTHETERKKDCLFIPSPNSLTELSIAVSEAIKSLSVNEVFLFMDSLSTLLIYNSAITVAKFSHFLMSKLRTLGVTGVFMSVEEEMEGKLLSQISSFCDKVIKLNKGVNK